MVWAFGLAIFYCLSMNVGIYYSILPGSVPTSHSDPTHHYVSVSDTITCNSIPNEKTVSSVKVFPVQNYKVHFKDLTCVQILFDQLLETQFDFNNRFLNRFNVQTHKFNITFPFHHFG